MNVSLKLTDNYEYVMNLFQYYSYDMSEFMGWPPYENGTFIVDDFVTGLSDYWNKPEHFPYLIMVDDEVAGFSLVRKFPDNSGEFDMGQFFVLRKYKRKGIGEMAFKLTVQNHPGKWLTRVLPNNLGAKKFWGKAIDKVSIGNILITNELYKNNLMEFMRYSVSNP